MSSNDAPTRVIISGCGIAGPVLAIFLKRKGYDPVVYERLDGVTEQGLSLALQPNGLKVLSLIPGVIEQIPGQKMDRIVWHSVVSGSGEQLADNDLPQQIARKYGYGMVGVQRTAFHHMLVETAEKCGVKIFWGHKLVALEQGESSVTVKFANGVTAAGSFVVGCDGLHSNTRLELFGRENADFTGLTQTGGISPIPAYFAGCPTGMNIFGHDSHMIAYAVSSTTMSWAVTQRQSEEKETWRAMDQSKQEEFKKGPIAEWGFGAGDLIKSANHIVKYGLYDRPALETWHKGRVVLVGDAAHPTSPHLGQGANQAFEDIYHLVRLLAKHNSDGSAPSTDTLSTIFTEYERLRIPRTAELVKGARKQGETRVVSDLEACKQRDEEAKQRWQNEAGMLEAYDNTFKEPFALGESEI